MGKKIMKDETRKNYAAEVIKAKEVMRDLADACAERGILEVEWKPLWERLDYALEVIEAPLVSSLEASNAFRPAVASVSRLYNLVHGLDLNTPAPIETMPVTEGFTEELVNHVMAAQKELDATWQLIVKRWSFAEEIPIVVDLKGYTKKLQALAMQIAKTPWN